MLPQKQLCWQACFVSTVSRWVRTNFTLAMWAKEWSELPVAVSLGDALSISEVRLPKQSVVDLITESVDCAKTCPRIGRTACFKQ